MSEKEFESLRKEIVELKKIIEEQREEIKFFIETTKEFFASEIEKDRNILTESEKQAVIDAIDKN